MVLKIIWFASYLSGCFHTITYCSFYWKIWVSKHSYSLGVRVAHRWWNPRLVTQGTQPYRSGGYGSLKWQLSELRSQQSIPAWLVTSAAGCAHSSYSLTPPPAAKDRAGLHPLGRQRANISLAIMCVYVSINTCVYIGTHIGRFLIKSLWTLFLSQLKATDEEACFLAGIQLCTLSASGMLMRPALFKWAP